MPAYIPDEELFHILQYYGNIPVFQFKHDIHKDAFARGKLNGTRRIDLDMDEGKSMPSFFWLDGLMDVDNPVRVTVKHINQKPQCYNCLYIGDKCPGRGNGKSCKKNGGRKRHHEDYAKQLFSEIGYKTLRQLFSEQNAPSPINPTPELIDVLTPEKVNTYMEISSQMDKMTDVVLELTENNVSITRDNLADHLLEQLHNAALIDGKDEESLEWKEASLRKHLTSLAPGIWDNIKKLNRFFSFSNRSHTDKRNISHEEIPSNKNLRLDSTAFSDTNDMSVNGLDISIVQSQSSDPLLPTPPSQKSSPPLDASVQPPPEDAPRDPARNSTHCSPLGTVSNYIDPVETSGSPPILPILPEKPSPSQPGGTSPEKQKNKQSVESQNQDPLSSDPVPELVDHDLSCDSQCQGEPVTVNIGGKTFNTRLACKKDTALANDTEVGPDKEPPPENDMNKSPDNSEATVSPSKEMAKLAEDTNPDFPIFVRQSSQKERKNALRKSKDQSKTNGKGQGNSVSPKTRGKKKS